MLIPITLAPDQPVLAAVVHALHHRRATDLAQLPTLTNIALGDPYLAEQLAALHRDFELQPPPATTLLARLRTRLAWWLLGREMQQITTTHAELVRVLDSLVVQLDQERIARRRIEAHLAEPEPPTGTTPPAPATLPPNLPSALVWHSTFAAPTGYSGSARAFVLGLDARGIAVRPLYLYGTDYDEQLLMGQLHPRIRALQATPVPLDAPQVVYAPGDRFSKNSGSYRIGFTMLEVDRLPPTWVQQANQMHAVWTPTAWGAEVFQASGVTRPIHVVPLGVDSDTFTPALGPRTQLGDVTIFLAVFEWGIRKGWDLLLDAYAAAFRRDDPVLLLLKVDCREPAANPLREMLARLQSPTAPIGLIYNQTLTATQLRELYHLSDCFVLPTRGEGWGMPILEAMACGIPAIATDWSAPTAFLDPHNGYPLPITGLVAADPASRYYRDARWAEPDRAALTELLRHVAAHPHERRQKGQHARHTAQQWTWERAVDAVLAGLG